MGIGVHCFLVSVLFIRLVAINSHTSMVLLLLLLLLPRAVLLVDYMKTCGFVTANGTARANNFWLGTQAVGRKRSQGSIAKYHAFQSIRQVIAMKVGCCQQGQIGSNGARERPSQQIAMHIERGQ
jgi:hypothetical protein